jgi:hypothetical protein
VEISGKNDAGYYQDDPALGPAAVATFSRTWFVQSAFEILPGVQTGAGFTLQFPAAAGNAYSILYRDGFDVAHPWTRLFDVPPQISTGPISLTDSNASAMRFYRVITPPLP